MVANLCINAPPPGAFLLNQRYVNIPNTFSSRNSSQPLSRHQDKKATPHCQKNLKKISPAVLCGARRQPPSALAPLRAWGCPGLVCGHGYAPAGALAWCLPGPARWERSGGPSATAGASSCGRGAKRMGLAVAVAAAPWGKRAASLAGLSFAEWGGAGLSWGCLWRWRVDLGGALVFGVNLLVG
jgi:hypothetical protein